MGGLLSVADGSPLGADLSPCATVGVVTSLTCTVGRSGGARELRRGGRVATLMDRLRGPWQGRWPPGIARDSRRVPNGPGQISYTSSRLMGVWCGVGSIR